MAVIPDEPCCHYGVFAFTNIAEATVGRVFLTWSFLYSDFCISWFFSALPPPPKLPSPWVLSYMVSYRRHDMIGQADRETKGVGRRDILSSMQYESGSGKENDTHTQRERLH